MNRDKRLRADGRRPWRMKRRWQVRMTTLVALCGAVPLGAQVTYTVFPAVSPQSSVLPVQPTDQSALVTLEVRDSTLAYVVRALVHQANLRVMFDSNDPTFAKHVTVRVVKFHVMDALATVLKGTGLAVKKTPDGETVMIRAQPGVATRLAGGIVVGRVTDSASGQGLGGASVKVEGTKSSAVTSDSGHFTLKDVPPGDQVLTVRLFGYKPAERTVTVVDSERTTVRIVLVPVPTVLSGVVTTATGQQRRVEVGNDITVLNADSIQRIAPVSNLTQMLETRVPGLVVQHTSGIPGAPSRLRLRGLSSINGSSDPILIVDGIRVYADQSQSISPGSATLNGDITNQTAGNGGSLSGGGSHVGGFAGPSALDQIDPNAIETIEVLKGPSATAIYGSDAASGVIVITTKHGRVGPTHWNLALDQGRTTLPGSWPTNIFLFCPKGVGGSETSKCTRLLDVIENGSRTDSLVAFQALDDPRYSPLAGQPGQNRDASLTVSGGSGALTYSVTGSASTQRGYLHLPPIERQRFETFHGFPAPGWMVTPDQYTTYGASSSLTVQLGQTGGTLTLSNQLFRAAQQQSSLQTDLAALSQLYVDTTQLASQPLFSDYYTRAQLHTTTFTNAVSLSNFAPWRWLPLHATAGLTVQNQDNNTLLPRDYITCLGNTYDASCGTDSLGEYAINQGTNTTGSLTVGTLLRQRLVSTAVGINVYTIAQSNIAEQTLGLPIGVEVPSHFDSASSYATTNSATYGWYVQPTLNLNSRFFVSPGFRLDGGSASGGSRGGGSGGVLSFFPKLDLSWIAVTRSPSTPLLGALTLLRPRIAFGIAGVQPSPGEQLRLLLPYQITPYTASGSAGTPVPRLSIQTLGNTQLHPERDRELEGGFDAEFWNQRLTLTLTGYDKMSYDAILAIPVAPSVLGEGTAIAVDRNVGTIQNKGLEAAITARVLDARFVSWTANANIAKNANKLVRLVPGQPPLVEANTGYSTRLTPGYPLFGYWAQPIVGFYDANHNGVIEPGEVSVGDSALYVGAQQPSYEVTLSSTLALFSNRLSINSSFDYQNGLTQLMSATSYALQSNDPTTTPAQQAAIAEALGCSGPQCTAIGQLQTVNTLRWQTLSITYLVPPSLSRRVRVPSLSLALQGSNLGSYSHYRGKDANVNSYASGNLTRDDGNALPQPRVWNLRVTIGD